MCMGGVPSLMSWACNKEQSQFCQKVFCVKGWHGKNMAQKNHTAPRLLSSTGPQHVLTAHNGNSPAVPQLAFFPIPRLATSDLLHFPQRPYPITSPIIFSSTQPLFLMQNNKKHQAYIPWISTLHRHGAREEGNCRHNRRRALSPSITPILSLQFLTLYRFSLAFESPWFFKINNF